MSIMRDLLALSVRETIRIYKMGNITAEKAMDYIIAYHDVYDENEREVH